MAINLISITDQQEKFMKTKVLVFLLQMALENDQDFVDDEDLEEIILGATDEEQDWVEMMTEEEKTEMLTDLNILLSAAYE